MFLNIKYMFVVCFSLFPKFINSLNLEPLTGLMVITLASQVGCSGFNTFGAQTLQS